MYRYSRNLSSGWPSAWRAATATFAVGLVIGGLFATAREKSLEPAKPEIHADRIAMSGNAAPALGRYPVDVLRVVDGDTFEARVHIWPGLDLTTRVRLRSIDAPELKAKCEPERLRAEAARDTLRTILNERDVSIWSVGPDKYFGRIVAEASTRKTENVSAAMRGRGVARDYAGGRRTGWCDGNWSGG